MTDPISLTAGIVGLTTFALQSSKILYEILENVKSNGKSIRDLKEETISVSSVLTSLEETLKVAGVDFSALRTPLLRCGRICEELTVLIKECSQRADRGRFSLRDFILYTYKGKDIDELRSLISAYKSTIAIALADANIRQVTITTKLLREYKQTIDDTTCDLDELLQRFEDNPPSPTAEGNVSTQSQTPNTAEAAEEKASIEECLRICANVSKHIEQVQKESVQLRKEPVTLHYKGVTLTRTGEAGHITSQRLQKCKTEIGLTTTELRLLLQETEQRLARLSVRPSTSGRSAAAESDALSMEEEVDGIRQSLSICREATESVTSERVNVFEEVSMDDDGNQIIVSTFGDLVSAKCVKVGARSMQLLGQMSDETLQHFSREYNVRQNHRQVPERPSNEGRSTGKDPASSRFTGSGKRLS